MRIPPRTSPCVKQQCPRADLGYNTTRRLFVTPSVVATNSVSESLNGIAILVEQGNQVRYKDSAGY